MPVSDENTRADDGADAESREAQRTERLLQALAGSSDAAIRASMLLVRKSADMCLGRPGGLARRTIN